MELKTSALGFGGTTGVVTGVTESWNGSAWTEVADLNTSRRQLPGAGTDNTSSLAFGGETPGSGQVGNTESWNGSAWTEVNDLVTNRNNNAGLGTATAALSIGGDPGTSRQTQLWNGTSWTQVGTLNTNRNQSAAGTTTEGIAFGGYVPPTNSAATELWDGTIWTTTTDLNIARSQHSGTGTQTAALAFGGEPPPTGTATEEWNANVAIGAWVTGGNLNKARNAIAGAGNSRRCFSFWNRYRNRIL